VVTSHLVDQNDNTLLFRVQQHRFTYNEPMPVESCTQSLCDLALQFGEDDEEGGMVRASQKTKFTRPRLLGLGQLYWETRSTTACGRAPARAAERLAFSSATTICPFPAAGWWANTFDTRWWPAETLRG